MSHVAFVEEIPQELAEFVEEARRRGTPTEKFIRVMAHNPAVLKAWGTLWRQVFWEGELDGRLKEKVRLYIARQFACSN
jgi:hypothetical protein